MTMSKYPTERCWETGEYSDDCECRFCQHQYECSGADLDDEEDDD